MATILTSKEVEYYREHPQASAAVPCLCDTVDALQAENEQLKNQLNVKTQKYIKNLEAALAAWDEFAQGIEHVAALTDRVSLKGIIERFPKFPTPKFKKREIEDLVQDALRYRWLRNQHWDTSKICCVIDPKNSTKLGSYLPSGQALDTTIDKELEKGDNDPCST